VVDGAVGGHVVVCPALRRTRIGVQTRIYERRQVVGVAARDRAVERNVDAIEHEVVRGGLVAERAADEGVLRRE
jgi:hypothetical protein